jgi:hypothetical protein
MGELLIPSRQQQLELNTSLEAFHSAVAQSDSYECHSAAYYWVLASYGGSEDFPESQNGF